MVFTTLKQIGWHRSHAKPEQTLWQRIKHVQHILDKAPAATGSHIWSWLLRGDTGMIPVYEEVEYDPWPKS